MSGYTDISRELTYSELFEKCQNIENKYTVLENEYHILKENYENLLEVTKEQEAANQALIDQNTQLQKDFNTLDAAHQEILRQLSQANRTLYGTSSEKLPLDQDDLFDMEPIKVVLKKKSKASSTSPRGKKTGGFKERAVTNVPIEVHEHTLDCDNATCPICEGGLQKFGKKLAFETLIYVPAKIIKEQHYRWSYKCHECDKHDVTTIVQAKAPKPIIEKSLVSASLLAAVIYQKYGLHLPYARQEKEWEKLGANFSRRTLANWPILACEKYLNVVYERLVSHLLDSPHIHADETPYQILRRSDGRSARSDSWIWIYATGYLDDYLITLYQSTLTRSYSHPEKFLEDYQGSLTCDGFGGYEGLNPSITLQHCWSHVRRYFYNLPDDVPIKSKAMKYIGKIFSYESTYSEEKLLPEERQKRRKKQSSKVVREFFSWLETLPFHSKATTKAINYTLTRRETLVSYISDGSLEITNNRAERLVRPVKLIKNNANFSVSEDGAKSLAVCMTIIQTAKLNGLDPEGYLTYLFEGLSQMDLETVDTQTIDEYLPWSDRTQQNCPKLIVRK